MRFGARIFRAGVRERGAWVSNAIQVKEYVIFNKITRNIFNVITKYLICPLCRSVTLFHAYKDIMIIKKKGNYKIKIIKI